MWQIFGACIITAILVILSCRWLNRRLQRKKDRQMANMVREFVNERNKSEAILADLDIGVIAYSSDGVLINHNPAARKMLQPDKVPQSLTEYVSRYGQENGIQAALLLGNETISGLVLQEDSILRVRLKESRFDEGRRAGTIVVMQDITDQEREEKQRKEFVANVSHELKTPLTTIKTYSESLLEWGLAEKSKEAIHKDIWRIHDDSLRMEKLVEDLLLLSSIDSRGLRVRLELLDITQVVRQVVDRLQLQAKDKSIDMACYAVSRIPLVFADRTAMERVITNLAGNAIKYTEKGGSVKIYISHLVDDVCIKVQDSGFGIEKEHLTRIFNRFYRVDMTGSRMFGGTGLGLSIARELVELHDGKISASSVLGKGTEFTVMIPIARKLLESTFNAYQTNSLPPDMLHEAAASELKQMIDEQGLASADLAELDNRQIRQMLDRILEKDEATSQEAPDLPNQLEDETGEDLADTGTVE